MRCAGVIATAAVQWSKWSDEVADVERLKSEIVSCAQTPGECFEGHDVIDAAINCVGYQGQTQRAHEAVASA